MEESDNNELVNDHDAGEGYGGSSKLLLGQTRDSSSSDIYGLIVADNDDTLVLDSYSIPRVKGVDMGLIPNSQMDVGLIQKVKTAIIQVKVKVCPPLDDEDHTPETEVPSNFLWKTPSFNGPTKEVEQYSMSRTISSVFGQIWTPGKGVC